MFPESITTEYIISQSIGAITLILVCVSFFLKKKKLTALVGVSNIILALSYFFLNSYVAAIGTVLGAVRCWVFYFCEVKYNKVPKAVFCISILFFVASTLIFWSSPYDLFEFGVLLTFTIALILKEEWQVRSLLLVNKILALIFNALIFNYVGVLCKVIEIIVLIIALIKFLKHRKKELVQNGQ